MVRSELLQAPWGAASTPPQLPSSRLVMAPSRQCQRISATRRCGRPPCSPQGPAPSWRIRAAKAVGILAPPPSPPPQPLLPRPPRAIATSRRVPPSPLTRPRSRRRGRTKRPRRRCCCRQPRCRRRPAPSSRSRIEASGANAWCAARRTGSERAPAGRAGGTSPPRAPSRSPPWRRTRCRISWISEPSYTQGRLCVRRTWC
mmetsp:Transcript_29034/g.82524  ORF Transcript_29034/g.82524 Transcript_29034/m.82524 type:complete len:201 (+) Transcript_29034:164-766(+)